MNVASQVDLPNRERPKTTLALRSFGRVFRIVWAASPGYNVLVLFLTLLTAGVLPAQIWMSKLIIDRVINSIQTVRSGKAIVWYSLLSPIVLILAVWTIGGLCQSLSTHLRMLLGDQPKGTSATSS